MIIQMGGHQRGSSPELCPAVQGICYFSLVLTLAGQRQGGLRPAWSNSMSKAEAAPREQSPFNDAAEVASASSDREAVPSSIFAASRKLQGTDDNMVPPPYMTPGKEPASVG